VRVFLSAGCKKEGLALVGKEREEANRREGGEGPFLQIKERGFEKTTKGKALIACWGAFFAV